MALFFIANIHLFIPIYKNLNVIDTNLNLLLIQSYYLCSANQSLLHL